MNLRILFASFCLIFLAELGDKTQLTALAFSTSSRSPWSVFLGTSLALICTTALAVVCGEALSRWVPAKVLHLASAVMFVLVGLILLVNLARKAPAEEAAPAAPSGAVPGAAARPLSSFVGRQAVALEEDLATFIHENAPKVTNPDLRRALDRLEDKHRAHAAALADIGRQTDAGRLAEMDADLARGDAEGLLTALRQAGQGLPADATFERIIRRQEAAAEFYIALAQLIRFHDARDVLRALAMEEIHLAQETCTLLHPPAGDA
jgi:Ca2+/H+ antiporter, TMEM165/GDT1 family